MADEAPPEEGIDMVTKILVGAGVFLVISALLGGFSISSILSGNQEPQDALNPVKDFFSTESSEEEMLLGGQVINTQEVQVRREAASAVIGTQSARVTGTLLEGPVEAYGKQWWRVDYEEAPDGWVQADAITARVSTFRAYNIFPIIYWVIFPFLIIISVLLALLFLILKVKSGSIDKHAAQKKALLEEEYKEKRAYAEPVGPVFSAAGIADLPTGEEGEVESTFDPASFVGASDSNQVATASADPQESKNKRWVYIQELRQSPNVNDWRQAILEADIILEQILEKIGYEGASVGDRLKSIPKGDMISINQAWEAHKVRNIIAHSGAEHQLSRQEVDQVLKNYEKVFREYYYI